MVSDRQQRGDNHPQQLTIGDCSMSSSGAGKRCLRGFGLWKVIGAVSGNGIIKINLLLHAFPVVTAKR